MITSLPPGTRLGRYKVHSLLGAGLAEVFLAYDTLLDRNVALKILSVDLLGKRQQLNRFEQEARAASALNHPNIITIHEIGAEGNIHFIATEFVEGETLRLKLQTPLEIREALKIATQIAAALDAAHQSGIVHRDIKPENVMLRTDGVLKVLDFGLAKLTEKTTDELIDSHADTRPLVMTTPGTVVGTIAYMSPEQARGLEVDARTDIFSLGVVLYEMLTGRRPFEGATVSDVLAAILKSEPAPLCDSTPAELQRIVRKLLQKDVNERYQTSKDLLIDLKSLMHTLDFSVELERLHFPGQSEKPAPTPNQIVHPSSWLDNITGLIKRHKRIFTSALVFLVIGVLGYLIWQRPPPVPHATEINSIAVLPFQNSSGDSNLDYLSDGLSESLIDKLSQLPQLKVIARNSSFKYRGENIDTKDVANELGVQAIIMGKVLQRGDNLTIKVEMIDVSENKQLWGEQYNRRVADLLTVQQEIAQIISEKLRLKITGAQEQQLAKRPTENPEAYQLYLTGQLYSRMGTLSDHRKALDYYSQAIAIDPHFALAYAHVALSYFVFEGFFGLDPRETEPHAKLAAQKALELDETLAEAHVVMGIINRIEWQWSEAESQYKRAIALNPNLALARAPYASLLSWTRRHSEALAESRRAVELDPLNINYRIKQGSILRESRRYDDAVQYMQNLIRIQPDDAGAHYELGYSYAGKRMYEEALAEYRKSIGIDKEYPSDLVYIGSAYAMMGKRSEALAMLSKLKNTREYVSPAELAILYASLGDKDEAFNMLERAYAAHDFQLQYLSVESHYDSLRSDPRFRDLLRRVGLPP